MVLFDTSMQLCTTWVCPRLTQQVLQLFMTVWDWRMPPPTIYSTVMHSARQTYKVDRLLLDATALKYTPPNGTLPTTSSW